MSFDKEALIARLEEAIKAYFENYQVAMTAYSMKYADQGANSRRTIGAAQIALEHSKQCFDYAARRFVNYCAHYHVDPAAHLDVLESVVSTFIEKVNDSNREKYIAQAPFRSGPDHFPETYEKVAALKARIVSDAKFGEVGIDVLYKHQSMLRRHYDLYIKDVVLAGVASAIFGYFATLFH